MCTNNHGNDLNSTELCHMAISHSNDLWRFDPVTTFWSRLVTSGLSFPVGREQHSASVIDGKLVIIGGLREDDGSNVFLGDVWEMNPGRITNHTVEGSNDQELPAALQGGKVLYHSTTSNITRSDDDGKGNVCVSNIRVEVQLEHTCIEQIEYIVLYGPNSSHMRSSRGHQIQVSQQLFTVNVPHVLLIITYYLFL